MYPSKSSIFISFITISILSIYSILYTYQSKLIYIIRDYSEYKNYYINIINYFKYYETNGSNDNDNTILSNIPKIDTSASSNLLNSKLIRLNLSNKQYSYFIPSIKKLDTLIICFGGNAQLALDWVPFINSLNSKNYDKKDKLLQRDNIGVLLMEYPSYGDNSNNILPAPATILLQTELALLEISKLFSLDLKVLYSKITLLGHSLGCAAALQFASKYFSSNSTIQDTMSPTMYYHKIILVSPFTTLLEMTNVMIPFTIPFVETLLEHKWDNAKRLTELITSYSSDSELNQMYLDLFIFHGDKDEIVPVRMSRDLEMHCRNIYDVSKNNRLILNVQYEEIPFADHNTMFEEQVAGIKIAKTLLTENVFQSVNKIRSNH